MNLLELIKSRRSIRKFSEKEVAEEHIQMILEAGRWAPSGLNNQPWRFMVARDKKIRMKLSELTSYGEIIKNAPVCILVFLDSDASYDRIKDTLAVGACIQNMLLEAHSLGLGAVWLGEILKNKDKVALLLKAPSSCELMAVVALGHPLECPESERLSLDELILS